jgi:membrane protein DedA with SNARE-associated domain/pimeloyl-ACP methyl ester carboxylesterase
MQWLVRYGWKLYLLMLIASWVWQFAWVQLDQREVKTDRQVHRVTVSAKDRAGEPIAGRASRIAWSATEPKERQSGSANQHGATDTPGAGVVVMLHGIPGDRHQFDLLADQLGEKFRVIQFDLPGFGDSYSNGSSLSATAYAHQILELLKAQDIEHFHLVGHTTGNGVALQIFNELQSQQQSDRLSSITMLRGLRIDAQNGPGHRSFDAVKFALGYPFYVLLPEVLPHFGSLGTVSERYSTLRHYQATDRQPWAAILKRMDQQRFPVMLMHGRDDQLASARRSEALQNHLEMSRLVILESDGGLLGDEEAIAYAASEIAAFVDRFENGEQPTWSVEHQGGYRELAEPILPIDLDLDRYANPWVQVLVIMIGSYIIEDPTTIAVGLLVQDGQLDLILAIIAIFGGVFTGDLALYLVGRRFGKRALDWPVIAKRLPAHHVDALGHWFDRHGWSAVLVSRFIPGSRTPLYIAAGALARKPLRFAFWTLIAIALWAPVMVLLIWLLGDAAASPFKLLFGHGWAATIAALATLLLIIRLFFYLSNRRGRNKLRALFGKWRHHEFWPGVAFNLPPLIYWLWLSVKYTSLTLWTLANPAMTDGNGKLRTKSQALALFDSKNEQITVTPTAVATDVKAVESLLHSPAWSLPLVMKPDAGRSGRGMRIIREPGDIARYFQDSPGPAIVQSYLVGPMEVTAAYHRDPETGRVSIPHLAVKHFPILLGDGRHTLQDLFWNHPRYRQQASVFLQRFEEQEDRVLAKGEALKLVEAGSHAQGAKITDGADLITAPLVDAIAKLAMSVEGFCMGSFDIRFGSLEDLAAGQGLHVFEVNGVRSLPGYHLDPQWSVFRAWRAVFGHWSEAYRLGDYHRRHDKRSPPKVHTVIKQQRESQRDGRGDRLSD